MADDKKAKIVNLLKETKTKKARKKSDHKPSLSIVGNGNIQAGGDVNLNKREVIRNSFTPGPEHITASQAKKLQDLVQKAVELEATAGVHGGDQKKLFAKWWKILKDQYNVPNYQRIPLHLGDHAIAWFKQRIATLRPKLRRTDNASWRKEHYTGIYARAKELGMSKGEVYAIVAERLGKQVQSLTKLGEQDLKKLYNIIMAMRI